MNPYKYTVSIRLRHPSNSLKNASQILSKVPELHTGRLKDIDEQRRSPKGDKLEGLYKESLFSLSLTEDWNSSEKQDLTDNLNLLLDKIMPYRSIFDEIVATGGKVELFIGLGIDSNSGIVFDTNLIKRLSDMKIELSFDIYPPDNL